MSLSRRTVCALGVLLLVGCPEEIPIPFEPPEARIDYALTALDTPVTLAPLLNDFDPSAELLSVVSITTPSNGTATLNPDGTVDYTPNLGFLGGDSFEVTIVDASGNEASNSVHVTVGPSVRAVYRSNWNDVFTNQLYMADSLHPETMIPLSVRVSITVGPVVSRQQVTSYIPTTDGVNLLYTADTDTSAPIVNLWHVDLRKPWLQTQLTDMGDGIAIGALSLPLLSPDGLYAYYMSNEFAFSTPRQNQFDIIRVEIANPANKTRMNAPLGTGLDSASAVIDDFIERFQISEDGTKLFYVVRDVDATPTFANSILYMVDVATPEVVTKLSGNATAGTLGVVGSLTTIAFRQVPGTTKLVYAGSEEGATTQDLYLTDYATLTGPVKLSGTSLGPAVANYSLTPDGSRILYVSREHHASVVDLYGVEISNPGVSTRLTKPRTPPATGDVPLASFIVGQDNTFVLYVRDDDTADINELYMVEFANPTVQIKLNHALRPAGTVPLTDPAEEVFQVRVSPGAPRRVLYSTNDQTVDLVTKQTLRMVDVDDIPTKVVVGPSVLFGFGFGWGPDGDTVLYQNAPPDRSSPTSLYMVKISAPTVSVRYSNEDNPGDVAIEPSFVP
jgi:hypothetical protein